MDENVYFFAGNCQLQYIAAMVGAVTPAPRYFVGHRFNVNVALDGSWPDHLERREFFRRAAETRQQGRRTVLLVQETSRSAYSERMEKRRDLFDDLIQIPHLHFGSLWPDRRLKTELDKISDRQIKRVFDWERHDALDKLKRCGVEDAAAFAEQQWERSRSELRFYHPGHPNGELFADTLAAMRGHVDGRLPFLDDLVGALRRSHGIYQNSTHPISSRVGPILDLAWARTELYQAWLALSEAAKGGEALHHAADRAEAVLADPVSTGVVAPPFHAHFMWAVGNANIRCGNRRRGLRKLEQATIALKGFGPLLRRTLTAAVQARRLDTIERTLVGIAPWVEANGKGEAAYDACFKGVLGLPEGRATLGRVRERTDPSTWLNRTLETSMATA